MESNTRTWTDELTVFDLETTGIDVETCRIVTAHVGVLDARGTVIQHRDWVINPGVPIPERATAVHGITTEFAEAHGAQPFIAIAEIVSTLAESFAAGRAMVAYNAPYDLTVLDREAKRYAIVPLGNTTPIIDPLVIDKALDRYRRGKRTLAVTAAHYGVSLEGAHEASADAICAGRLAQALARAHPQINDMTAHDLHTQQIEWAGAQAANYQEWRRANGSPDFVASGSWPRH